MKKKKISLSERVWELSLGFCAKLPCSSIPGLSQCCYHHYEEQYSHYFCTDIIVHWAPRTVSIQLRNTNRHMVGPALPLPYSFVCVLLCFLWRRIIDRKYCPGPLTLGLCPLPLFLSIHLSFILNTAWVLTVTLAGWSWRWELTARPHFPLQLLPGPQHPLPEFSSSSSFSCLHLSDNPLSPVGTILVCMDVQTTTGAWETYHEPHHLSIIPQL